MEKLAGRVWWIHYILSTLEFLEDKVYCKYHKAFESETLFSLLSLLSCVQFSHSISTFMYTSYFISIYRCIYARLINSALSLQFFPLVFTKTSNFKATKCAFLIIWFPLSLSPWNVLPSHYDPFQILQNLQSWLHFSVYQVFRVVYWYIQRGGFLGWEVFPSLCPRIDIRNFSALF